MDNLSEKKCVCNQNFKIVDRFGDDLAQLLFCNKCCRFDALYQTCEHKFKTYKIIYDNGSIHVKTKCSMCGQQKETHKKNDFELNSLPIYDKSIEDELMNRNMAIHYQFNKTQEELRLQHRKETNEWNIEQCYQGYLLSNMWSKKRKWILEKQNFKCERCGDKAVQVHHLTYERVGYELPGDLMAVCLSCHGKEHSENPDLRILSQFKLNNL